MRPWEKRREAKRRLTNVEFGNALLVYELDYRNSRKRDQENSARALIVASGALMTVLLALSGDTGVLSTDASWWTRGSLLLTLCAAVGAAACGAWVQFPRRYRRLGAQAFDEFNNPAFLDSPEDQVLGQTLAARIAIAKRLDDRHEDKAGWLKASFALFLVSLLGLLGQGATLAVDPPHEKPSTARRMLLDRNEQMSRKATIERSPPARETAVRAAPRSATPLGHESGRTLMASEPRPAPLPPPDVAYPPLPTETDTRDGSQGGNK